MFGIGEKYLKQALLPDQKLDNHGISAVPIHFPCVTSSDKNVQTGNVSFQIKCAFPLESFSLRASTEKSRPIRLEPNYIYDDDDDASTCRSQHAMFSFDERQKKQSHPSQLHGQLWRCRRRKIFGSAKLTQRRSHPPWNNFAKRISAIDYRIKWGLHASETVLGFRWRWRRLRWATTFQPTTVLIRYRRVGGVGWDRDLSSFLANLQRIISFIAGNGKCTASPYRREWFMGLRRTGGKKF